MVEKVRAAADGVLELGLAEYSVLVDVHLLEQLVDDLLPLAVRQPLLVGAVEAVDRPREVVAADDAVRVKVVGVEGEVHLDLRGGRVRKHAVEGGPTEFYSESCWIDLCPFFDATSLYQPSGLT